jgi:hypothetical protein
MEIHKDLGPEVLLLVALVTKTLGKMATLSYQKELISKLTVWWEAVSHPPSLKTAARVWTVMPPSKTSIQQELPVEAAVTRQHAADALGTFVFLVLDRN